jgi:hypothetical protein
MLTTLTTAIVLPLAGSDRFVACVCNVGDSLSYVYSAQHGVREITKGEYVDCWQGPPKNFLGMKWILKQANIYRPLFVFRLR